ncbi:hypothetical protein XBJ2_350002 [Xenorhabdus bovienii str. Jollieti]|uniref:Uncharacterized protein n=1 Tax=Xenorhabdus bovienii (strain SS-2004) TaxID=406818 RepID=D3UWR1_XENBS|nr:hypothetical protein [Xenorhabdus bovienii]CBJ79896.1 hypothetical protein XBJ1_0755 [Xenorhabdus bovienii SS-2004]CDH29606.1 hypothetical protein XBJ2_350002 [Xenorhabdus bovienii str. Jollieti]
MQEQIDTNIEGMLINSAAANGNSQYFMRQNGEMKSEIVKVRNFTVTETKSLAEKIDTVKATADKSWAAV